MGHRSRLQLTIGSLHELRELVLEACAKRASARDRDKRWDICTLAPRR